MQEPLVTNVYILLTYTTSGVEGWLTLDAVSNKMHSPPLIQDMINLPWTLTSTTLMIVIVIVGTVHRSVVLRVTVDTVERETRPSHIMDNGALDRPASIAMTTERMTDIRTLDKQPQHTFVHPHLNSVVMLIVSVTFRIVLKLTHDLDTLGLHLETLKRRETDEDRPHPFMHEDAPSADLPREIQCRFASLYLNSRSFSPVMATIGSPWSEIVM